MTELSRVSRLRAANPMTVARSAGRTGQAAGSNGGMEGERRREEESSNRVTACPGGGQLGDSDGGGEAPSHTVIMFLWSLLSFAALQTFFTTENPAAFSDLCSESR